MMCNLPQPLQTGPQHSLVSRTRATSGRLSVLIDFNLEVFVLLRNLCDLNFEFLRNIPTCKEILLQRVLHHFGINLFLSILHNLQRNDCFS